MFLGFNVNSCRPIDKRLARKALERLFSKDNLNSIDYKNNIIKRPIHSNTYLNLHEFIDMQYSPFIVLNRPIYLYFFNCYCFLLNTSISRH